MFPICKGKLPQALFLLSGLALAMPEFQAIGTSVGKLFSAALTGGMTVDQALLEAQATTEREMKRAGYPK